jgi:integrase
MTEKANLSPDKIRRAKHSGSANQTILWDADTRGLGLRITAAGAKSFIFEGRLKGKLRLTIGSADTWTIDAARKQARRYQAMLDAGRDPRVVKQEQTAADLAVMERQVALAATVGEAWTAYMTYQQAKMQLANLERGKKWGDRHLLDHQRMTQVGGGAKARGKGEIKPGVLLPLLPLKLSELTKDRLQQWLTKESATRATKARQAFEAFRAFLRWGATRPEYAGLIDLSVIEDKELRDHVPSRKAKGGHDDVLEAQQLAVWFSAVRGLDNVVASAYLQGLLITGARREELATLKWADIEWRWGAMFLHDKVDGTGQRKIPLTPYLRSLIETLPRRNEWVFSSPASESGRITEPRIPHNRALDKAGLPHVTLHGLRRSFLTLSEWVEMPQGIVSQIAGHKPSATAEKHYKSRPLDLLALWHGKYEAWMLERAGLPVIQSGAGIRLVSA